MSYARATTTFDPNASLTGGEANGGAVTGRSYVLRHWQGQLSLGQSYWVNGALVNVAILIGQAALLRLADGKQLRMFAWAFLAFAALALLSRLWSLVGIWRSAGRHVARGGRAFWAFAARAMVLLSLLVTVSTIPNLLLQVKEMALIAVGRDPLGEPALVSLSADGKSITIDGLVTSGVRSELERRLERAPRVATLVLNSRGGRILEALAISDLIKARKLGTHVDEDCDSACTLMFLAGHERSAGPLASLGFHQPDFPGMSATERDEVIARNRRDYRSAGMNEAFIGRIMTTPPNSMWYPDSAELVEAGVVNTIVVDGAGKTRGRARLTRILRQAVSTINGDKGTMVDTMTRLDGARLAEGTVVVDYTITQDITVPFDRVRAELVPEIRRKLCDGPDGALIRAGGDYRFVYRSSDRRELGSILIDDC